MLKILVKSAEVFVKSGISGRTQKPYTIREQLAYVDLGKAFPVEIKLSLPDGRPDAYPVGVYELDPSSFFVGRFGELMVKPVLVAPAQAA